MCSEHKMCYKHFSKHLNKVSQNTVEKFEIWLQKHPYVMEEEKKIHIFPDPMLLFPFSYYPQYMGICYFILQVIIEYLYLSDAMLGVRCICEQEN